MFLLSASGTNDRSETVIEGRYAVRGSCQTASSSRRKASSA
ncbi:hypothetical protein [Pseudogemmobacter bohemicus]|nr:hypothetical protein [Pseudogemmobacter bohemicus]